MNIQMEEMSREKNTELPSLLQEHYSPCTSTYSPTLLSFYGGFINYIGMID